MNTKKLLAVAVLATMGWSAQASAEDLVVAAASSLTNAFTEIGEQFQQANPGAKVLNTFSASGKLAAQVAEGAPIDVFASADQKAMDKAQDSGAIDTASRKDFARNQVVLIVPTKDPLGIKTVKDLASDKVTRVAFGNPGSVPVGRYTQASLEKSGDWDMVKKHEVLGQNVRQALNYVARGEVDAGFVFATDAAIKPDEVRVVQTLESPVPVLYPMALVKRDARSSLAQKYVDYVHSDKGQAVLAKYGFAKP